MLSPMTAAHSESVGQLLETIKSVGSEGQGHAQASGAWAELTKQADAGQLPAILAAMDDANVLAANWLRAAVDAIAERQLARGEKLPSAALEKYLEDRRHDPRARRLAYEWIVRADPAAEDRLMAGMLDDPSLELRRDAVARVIAAADAAHAAMKTDEAIGAYRKALDSARDLDQVKHVTEELKKLGRPVDLSHHFGFVVDWQLVGPFSNAKGVGFNTAYPPEEAIDLSTRYEGTSGQIAWAAHHTADEYGALDLNKAIGKHMGAVAYATVEFQSARAEPAEIRVGSPNAVKIWLNGKQLAAAEAYHANNLMDQYVGRGELTAGRNVILLKICQNEQTEDWAQDWKFQCRVCDPLGKAILAADRPAPSVASRGDNQKSASTKE
jgi:hypothetical protein